MFILYITTPLFIPAHGLGVDVMDIINIVVIIVVVVVVDIVERTESDNHGGFDRTVQTGFRLDQTG